MEIITTVTVDGAWAVYRVENNTVGIYKAKLIRRGYIVGYGFPEDIILHKTNGEWFSDYTNKALVKSLSEAIER